MRWLVVPLGVLLLFPALLAGDEAAHPKQNQAPAVVLDINQVSAAEFATLPGIGPNLAAQIVAYRDKHGPFRRIEDLLALRGIGPKKWRAIRPYLRVGAAPAVGQKAAGSKQKAENRS